MKIYISNLQKKILFHISLWSIWLYLTLSNANENELYYRTILMITLIVLTHIPLFIINTEWLIPKILRQKGVTFYVGYLLIAMIVFIVFHNFILDAVNEFLGSPGRKKGRFMTGMIPLLLVSAISTGYGLLNYVVIQEKQQQEKQKERLQSELSFLRSQISPHFIFNILNSIVYLIRSKSNLAEPVTLKLSELMRYMLYESEHAQIPLEKEVSYLNNYIELQKIRFEEDVQIVLNKEGEATTQTIEPMLLIPFVENAFKHGVGMVHKPAIIIDVNITDTALDFIVKNKIASEPAKDKDTSSGIGLKNIQRRLELLYPHTHRLDIKKENGWFVVNLHLRF
ncbi:MAG: histidine kinase [Saprospiraceae bacterium]